MPIFNDALKLFNTDKSKWTIPKKGTTEYNEVMQIMNDLKSKNAKQKEPKAAKKETKPKTKAPPRKQKIEPIKTDTTVRG